MTVDVNSLGFYEHVGADTGFMDVLEKGFPRSSSIKKYRAIH